MRKKIFRTVLLLFILVNVFSFIHAWHFTHFSEEDIVRSAPPEELSWMQKAQVLISGVSNPKPKNRTKPVNFYEELNFEIDGDTISGWWVPAADSAIGAVIIFHGYAGNKGSMLPVADAFLKMNWNVLLVDFPGHGSSSGHITSIGYHEANVVKAGYEKIKSQNKSQPLILFGTSMGAAAVMRAVAEKGVRPSAIILECPFGSMLQTVKNRFRAMEIPFTPAAHLLTFWGGVQQGFWAFGYEPREYAKEISIPALLMYGEKDKRVTRQETQEIFNNLQGPKELVIFPALGHELYVETAKDKWTNAVRKFVNINTD